MWKGHKRNNSALCLLCLPRGPQISLCYLGRGVGGWEDVRCSGFCPSDQMMTMTMTRMVVMTMVVVAQQRSVRNS